MPIEINEKIRLVRYDPKWQRLASREIAKLEKALGRTVFGIEHHGSTSIPGMAAKPIIDILIGVDRLNLTEGARKKLRILVYRYIGKRLGQERLYLVKRGKTNFNLGIVRHNSELWHDNLNLRDFLSSHPKAASIYARRKKEILNQGRNTLFEYSDAKACDGDYYAAAKKGGSRVVILPHMWLIFSKDTGDNARFPDLILGVEPFSAWWHRYPL